LVRDFVASQHYILNELAASKHYIVNLLSPLKKLPDEDLDPKKIIFHNAFV
jgi:hypothetical protein